MMLYILGRRETPGQCSLSVNDLGGLGPSVLRLFVSEETTACTQISEKSQRPSKISV